MDEIVSNLEPWQKTQLHEVADGMLEVYRTLARMQFIEEFDITQGPHDMSELLPFCRDLKVDDSIIYLYSILPYVEGGGDFVCRGAMLDLRKKRDIEEARNPMYANDDEAPRPWMTGLSSIANHDTALVYDARRHVIGMYCQEGFDSTDRNLHDRTPSISGDEVVVDSDTEDEETQGTPDAADKSDKEDNDNDTQMIEIESHTEEDSASEQWEDEGSDEGSDEESDEANLAEGNTWDEMEARPAPKVLRDIVRWYEQLIELPGDGEYSGTDWNPEVTKPLYIMHGWPRADFNGEAFLVEKARACAEASVRLSRQDDEKVRDEVAELEKQLSVHKDEKEFRRVRLCNNILANPGKHKFEDEWDARWQLHQIQETGKNLRQLLQAEKEKLEKTPMVDFKPTRQQLVLDNLKGGLRYDKWLVDNVKTQIAEAVGDEKTVKANRIRLPRLEKKALIMEKACGSYQKDENVTPLVRPNYCDGPMDLREHLWHAIQARKTLPEAIELSRQFLETVPMEAKRIKMEAEHGYTSQVKALEQSEEQVARLKKQLLDQGYTGWPLEHCD